MMYLNRYNMPIVEITYTIGFHANTGKLGVASLTL
jgi:hypothetical protein